MKRVLLRALFFLIPFLWSIYVSSQPKKEKDCSTTCFSSEVVSVEKITSSCSAYELKVTYSGNCAHALSHYSVAVPCGDIHDIRNSGNWKQVIGIDPTTGVNGFKIDDIAGFGEGSIQSFTVKFTVCSQSESCAAEMRCWQPVVAYKASTCVNYETLAISCKSLKGSLDKRDATCFGSDDGSLSVVIEDGQEPYTFLWSNSLTTQTVTGLTAGHYSVIVRDATGAEITLEETVSQGEKIDLVGTTTPATCNGMANGAIDLTASGGTAPYTYTWNNGLSTEDIRNILPGEHSVTVTDSKGCTATAAFTIGSSSIINITGTHVKPDCNDTNGSIDISMTGGTMPYTFQWSNGETTEDITGIDEGLYTVTVTDQGGCSQEKSFFIRTNNTLSLKGTTTAASCTDEATGSIDITVTGGTGPYTYAWSNGAGTEDITGISSGYYRLTITDAKGCTVNGGYTVSRMTFQVARTVVQPTCQGEDNGAISLQEPVGGTGPFTYEWSNGQTGTSITDLPPGSYSVIVTDATGCSRTVTATISDPSAISASATVSNTSCNADGSFGIDLATSGGTAPYTYEWSNGSTTEDLTGLDKGTYTVVIKDAHGCSISKEVVVQGESPTWSCLISVPSTNPACKSEGNIITTPVADADSYSWTIHSTDGLWRLSADNTPSVAYATGGENSSATFTLSITKDGCTQTCSVTVTSCLPEDDGGTDPGEEVPGGEVPGGEEPGSEEPGGENPGDGGSETCEECFSTISKLIDQSGDCRTYEMTIDTNGLCRHELSHWTLAIPCGIVSNYSNSEGWNMEFGQDPTTGLYGLKVDDISSFGKQQASFTVRFTLCESTNCELSAWNPAVGYKAGQCVGVETIVNESAARSLVAVYPNPFNEVINFEWSATGAHVNLEIIDQYGNIVSQSTATTGQHESYFIKLESSSLPKGMYYYRLTVDGKTYNGKISKR